MYQITILGNATEWCYYCWKGYLDNHPEVSFFKYSFPLPYLNSFIYKYLFKIYYPKGKRMMLRPIFRYFIQWMFRLNKSKKNILIIYDWNELATDSCFMNSLKKKCPQIVIVYVFTNIVKYTGAKEWGILDILNSYYDVVFAFDKADSFRYNFAYLPLIYAQDTKREALTGFEDIDLFYVGKAKDRLNIIHEIFIKAKSEGLKCDFNVINVPQEKQLNSEGIHYNEEIGYSDVIKRIKRSKCLLDVIQGDSTGLTIKVVESVIYGKKLITTNPNVLVELKGNLENILLYNKELSLKEFISSEKSSYSNLDVELFSPDVFVEKLKRIFEVKYCSIGHSNNKQK